MTCGLGLVECYKKRVGRRWFKVMYQKDRSFGRDKVRRHHDSLSADNEEINETFATHFNIRFIAKKRLPASFTNTGMGDN